MHRRTASFLFIALAAGCGGGSDAVSAPAVVVATALFPSTDLNLQLLGGVAVPVAVRATASNGSPAAGVAIAFSASAGTLSAQSVTTDASGTATAQWTPSTSLEAQTVTATVPGTLLSITTNAIVSISIVGTWRSVGLSPWLVSLTQNGSALKYHGDGSLGTTPMAFTGTTLGSAFQFAVSFGTGVTGTYTGTIQPSGTVMIGTFSQVLGGQLVPGPLTLMKDP